MEDLQNHELPCAAPADAACAEANAAPAASVSAEAPVSPAAPAKIRRQQRVFTTKDKILAWLSIFVGYLFCRTFFVWYKPLMGLIFTLALFTFAFVFYGKQKRKARSWFYPVTALVLSAGLFITGSPALRFFIFTYVMVAFFLFCQTGSDTALEERAGQLYVFETFKAILVSPFKSFDAAVQSIGSNKGGKKLGKTLLFIIAGIGIAIVPTVIVIGLLSYDRTFTVILDKIRAGIFDRILSRLWSVFFGIPFGMYFFGALYTGAHPLPDEFNSEKCVSAENKMKFMPALIGTVALLPLLFLYIVFIAAHADYYRAVFSGSLPEAFTYAQFARDGFFRLCVVAAINAVALILLRVFTRRTANGRISPVVKICTTVFSLVTIIISATAISQMLMYVSAYGLTRMRLYILWFMAVIILLFVLAILKQFIARLPFAPAALAVFVLCFGLLAIPDTDAFIAEHNYNCFASGKTAEIDVNYLEELGPSAIPTLCRIAKDEKAGEIAREHAAEAVERYAKKREEVPFYALGLPSIRADQAYKEYKGS